MTTVLKLRDIGFAYDSRKVVFERTHLEVKQGERVALVGSNGSGKTTLLHMMMGLLYPSEGSVEVFGKTRESEEDFHEVRLRTGLLFQDSDDQLFCPTVLEDVAFGPLNQGRSGRAALDTARRTLADLGLAGYADRVTYRLSEGEKRLVALATVLAMEPDLLLLDEPTTGLDEEVIERIEVILEALPVTMLAVSHDRAFLERITERSVALKNGGIVERAPEGGWAVNADRKAVFAHAPNAE